MLKLKRGLLLVSLLSFILLVNLPLFAQEATSEAETGWAEKIVEKLQTFVADYGLKVIGAIIFLIVGRIIAGIARNIVKKVLGMRKVDETVTAFIGTIVYTIVIIAVLLAVLDKFGVQTASFVAVLAAAGFAIGFALQGSLSNFAAGVMIIVFRPYKMGDFVDVAGVAGVVQEVHLFNTIIHTPDNIKVIVPNSKISGDVIKNVTGNDTRRVDLEIGISYGAPIGKAMEIAINVMKNHELVLDDPEPMVAVAELADSSVNLVVRPWVNTADYWTARFDVTKQIKEAFDANDIEIPFPQRVLHMASADSEE
jgi:small conductance mechanosensitive channel